MKMTPLAMLIFFFPLALLMRSPISNPGDFCPFAGSSCGARNATKTVKKVMVLGMPRGRVRGVE